MNDIKGQGFELAYLKLGVSWRYDVLYFLKANLPSEEVHAADSGGLQLRAFRY